MAKPSSSLPRDLQSDLHDLADDFGEKIARDAMIQMDYTGPSSFNVEPGKKCTCERYSRLEDDGYATFWHASDPNCEYLHLQPLPQAYRIRLP